MVSIARDAEIAERIWTKTNGALLSPKLNGAIADCGLSLLTISVEAVSTDGYLRLAKAKVDYQHFVDNIADLYSRRKAMDIYIKIVDTGLTADEKQKFFEDFQPISTHIAIENLMGWSNSGLKDFTLGMKPDTYDGLPFVDKQVCAYPLYVMAVNSDGSISLCGNDWSHQTVVGNVFSESLFEIWNGERMYEFRKMMLEGRRRENSACGDCYYVKIVPDNIDDVRLEILERLTLARGSQI